VYAGVTSAAMGGRGEGGEAFPAPAPARVRLHGPPRRSKMFGGEVCYDMEGRRPMTTPASRGAILLALALSAAAGAAEPEAKKDPYPEGESLEYRVRIKGFPGGAATLSVGKREKTGGRETTTLELHARSNAFVSKFYPLDDRFTSVIETSGGGTLRFRSDKNERNRRKIEESTVDPRTLSGMYYMRLHDGREARVKFRLDRLTQDRLSLVYHVRRLPLEMGTSDNVTILYKNKPHELRLMVDGLEEVAVPGLGTVWAKVVHPSVGPGLFSEKGHATLWLEEETHVMLKLLVEAPKANVSMTLIKAERSPLLEAPRR